MKDFQKRHRPGGYRGEVENLKRLYSNPTKPRRPWEAPKLPKDWRDRLPDSETYYRARVAKLGKANATGWAQGTCPFHDDHNASLSVNVREQNGGWRCFAGCGGGDLIGFHQRRIGKAFKEAVADLLGVRS
ncbi:MAG: CHC2 zinc finger domain-containing protein [Pseudoxanthomonas sp.]